MNYENIETMKEIARLKSVKLAQFNNGNHLRLYGKFTVDYWPETKRCWIFGTKIKAFKVNSFKDAVAISMKEKIPGGVSLKDEPVSTIVNLLDCKDVCLCCGSFLERYKKPEKTFTESVLNPN